MGRIKRDANETSDERIRRELLEKISTHAPKSERVSWQRKKNNLTKYIELIRPIENDIMDCQIKHTVLTEQTSCNNVEILICSNTKKLDALQEQQQEMFDKITEVRNEMIESCVHPYDELSIHDNIKTCKFCGRRMALVDNVS